MPQIIVTADHIDREQDPVMLRERINAADFESERFAANLVERLGWAVLDATEVEQGHPVPGDARPAPQARQHAQGPRHQSTRGSRRATRDLERVGS